MTETERSPAESIHPPPEERRFTGRFQRTLLAAFLALALLPMALVTTVSYRNARRSLIADAEIHLNTITELKTEQIQAYFNEVRRDLEYLAASSAIQRFLTDLIALAAEPEHSPSSVVRTDAWRRLLVARKAIDLRNYRQRFEYEDILIMDIEGNILFTVAEYEDLGTNVFSTAYSQTRFAEACGTALRMGDVAFSDFLFYGPAGNRVLGFLAAPIRNSRSQKIGALIFALTAESVDRIMRSPHGLGRTGDIYLIGTDQIMRSNFSRSTAPAMLRRVVDTDETRLFLAHLEAAEAQDPHVHDRYRISTYTGPRGKEVIGTHQPVRIAGITLGLIAEMEAAEATAAARDLARLIGGILTGTLFAVLVAAIWLSRRMVRPIRRLSHATRQVSAGEFHHELRIHSNNEIGELAHNFIRMIDSLRRAREESDAQNWIKTGQNKLSARMRGELDMATFCDNVITFLTPYLNAQVGMLHVADETGRLHPSATYAWPREKEAGGPILPGEGLVGQAALEKKHLVVSPCPEAYIQIRSGLGGAIPRSLLIYPVRMAGQVKGVIELGGVSGFADPHITFLNQVQESIAIGLHSVDSRRRLHLLLKQTQKQAEELQIREEELQQTNAELEEQTAALQQSEFKLQAQQEELRQTNEELQEQTQRLEEQKRSIEQQNTALEEARGIVEEKMRDLEMASKYKSEFLANMSHELRTPLNSIILLSKLVAENKEANLTADQVDSIRAIHASGVDLLSLINEVLDLSKVEAGRMELVLQEVDLGMFCTTMNRSFHTIAAEQGILFETDLQPDLPEVIVTDQKRLEQIVRNFLSNGIKFTTEGGVTLRVRPAAETDEAVADLLKSGHQLSDIIAFSVSDTGIGIPADQQKLVFEAFQQGNGTISRRYGGTGLGLSISRELARLIGGAIGLKSSPGQGSTFTLYLPKAMHPVPAADPAGANPSTPAVQRPLPAALPPAPNPISAIEAIADDRKSIQPADKSILIIEDDPTFLKILRDLSRKQGFKCIVAGDGETGLQFAEYAKPSAILLDIGLPGIDGWTVMARLKENLNTRHIPVHFISATDRPLDALKMGAVDFLTKPVVPEALDRMFQLLHRIIEKPVKDLLIVEDDPIQQKAMAQMIGHTDIQITAAGSGKEALAHLGTGRFDCMILDLGLPDIPGIELIRQIRDHDTLHRLPIIVYTGRELTPEESAVINQYAESTIIKGVDSDQKLLDETTLFLHRVETGLPESQRRVLRMMHDKEAVFADKTVLVVDDDMRNVFSLKKILEDKRIRVLVGRDGREGIQRLHRHPETSLVLMDIMMPEMDGYEAMRRIRSEARFKDLPIIALTAKAMKGDRAKCIQAGASDYLAKPVDGDRLLSVLRVWLYGT